MGPCRSIGALTTLSAPFGKTKLVQNQSAGMARQLGPKGSHNGTIASNAHVNNGDIEFTCGSGASRADILIFPYVLCFICIYFFPITS